jgi:hypothetical protein
MAQTYWTEERVVREIDEMVRQALDTGNINRLTIIYDVLLNDLARREEWDVLDSLHGYIKANVPEDNPFYPLLTESMEQLRGNRIEN